MCVRCVRTRHPLHGALLKTQPHQPERAATGQRLLAGADSPFIMIRLPHIGHAPLRKGLATVVACFRLTHFALPALVAGLLRLATNEHPPLGSTAIQPVAGAAGRHVQPLLPSQREDKLGLP